MDAARIHLTDDNEAENERKPKPPSLKRFSIRRPTFHRPLAIHLLEIIVLLIFMYLCGNREKSLGRNITFFILK
ncbi:MAG: hypothetical protein DME43_00890 [Verrucomicrobia bacterium]|nr:MAG: hypothetical protein DME43_00890 [Verrucomicrobiota bacterium]